MGRCVIISCEFAARCWLGLQVSSEGLPGAGQPDTETVNSLSWLLGAGCWQGSRWNSLLVGCLIIHPHNMAAGFSSEWVIQEKAKQKWEWYFWHSLKVIFYHLCHILRVVQTCPDSLGQKTTQKWWGEDTRGHVAGCLSLYNTYIFFLSAKKKKKRWHCSLHTNLPTMWLSHLGADSPAPVKTLITMQSSKIWQWLHEKFWAKND